MQLLLHQMRKIHSSIQDSKMCGVDSAHNRQHTLVEVMGFTQVVQRLQHEGIHPEEDRQVHQIRMQFASPSLLVLLVEACQPV